MAKLSKKQKEVLVKMNENNTYITYMKGLTPHCFLHSNLSYRISTATMFKLEELKMIGEKSNGWNASKYYLTELGKQCAVAD